MAKWRDTGKVEAAHPMDAMEAAVGNALSKAVGVDGDVRVTCVRVTRVEDDPIVWEYEVEGTS